MGRSHENKIKAIISAPGGRSECFKCFRPTSHCVCPKEPPFAAHCNILILQHPNERKKYYSTTKLVLGTLSNSKLLRGVEFAPGELERTIAGQNAYLLFPSDSAVDCMDVPLGKDDTVIVVDGTWSEAGKIVRRNPLLAQLPCLSFKTDLRSNYRIRKQPKENYLSTIECIGHLLTLNAQRSNAMSSQLPYQRLFNAFDAMVDQQIRHFPRMRAVENS